MEKDFKVKIIGLTENPQLLSTAGALGCFEEKSSNELLEELLALSEEQRIKKERGVLKNSFGRGHGSVGDQNYFIFSIEDLPRAATLQLCLPEYLAHLQQSLRRAKATRGFYLPEAIKQSSLATETETVLSQSFALYEEMVKAGIPEEDARYILSLYTKTNIQTGGDARELCHLWKMTNNPDVPSIAKEVVNEIMVQIRNIAPYLVEDFGFNYETLAWYPSSQLYANPSPAFVKLMEKYAHPDKAVLVGWHSPFSQEVTEEMITRAIIQRDEVELSNLKHIHFEFLAPMSLACFHQAIRQRTWNHSVESIYFAAERNKDVTPPSIHKSDFHVSYRNQYHQMMELYSKLLEVGVPRSEAIGVVPHSLKIFTLVHINGWNALHSIGKRTCIEAQWEIRRIARDMASQIKNKVPSLGKWSEPQCITYGYCPEIRDCGYYKKKK